MQRAKCFLLKRTRTCSKAFLLFARLMYSSRMFNKRKQVLAKAHLPKAALLEWSEPGLTFPNCGMNERNITIREKFYHGSVFVVDNSVGREPARKAWYPGTSPGHTSTIGFLSQNTQCTVFYQLHNFDSKDLSNLVYLSVHETRTHLITYNVSISS